MELISDVSQILSITIIRDDDEEADSLQNVRY
jgi:hypothetical protein